MLRGDGEALDRAVEQLFRGPLVERATAVDEHQPVADLLELAQVVRRHEHGAPRAGQGADQRPDVAHALWIEPVGGFIEDEQIRIAEQRGRDPEALLHAE